LQSNLAVGAEVAACMQLLYAATDVTLFLFTTTRQDRFKVALG